MCMARVDLPDDSGPKISTTRPRGTPPTPRAMSRAKAPVEIASIPMVSFSPMRITEPAPNCLSICPRAASSALARSPARTRSLSAVCLGFFSEGRSTTLSVDLGAFSFFRSKLIAGVLSWLLGERCTVGMGCYVIVVFLVSHSHCCVHQTSGTAQTLPTNTCSVKHPHSFGPWGYQGALSPRQAQSGARPGSARSG